MDDQNHQNDQNDHLGRLVLGCLVLTVCCWSLSALTAGDQYGARYDVEAVNAASWFAFLVFAVATCGLAIIGVLRPVERRWTGRKARRPSM